MSAALITGCNPVKPPAPEVKLAEFKPMQKHSAYSSALEALGEMIESFGDGDTAVMVETIQDKTASGGKLPNDVTLLTESALQNVGEKLIVFPYSENSLQNAAAQGLPLYGVRGAITEFDAETTSVSSGSQTGLFLKDVDASTDDSDDFSSGTIAMDFLIMDYSRGFYVPGVKATAKAKIEKASKSQGYSFSIVGNGFGVNGSTSSQTPVHDVINKMIEYSMVQLIGKLKEYPYWLAISGADPDYRQIKKMGKKYNRYDLESKHRLVSYIISLTDSGVAPHQTSFDSYTRAKVAQLKHKFNLPAGSSDVSKEFYLKLLNEALLLINQQQVIGQTDQMLDAVLQ